MSLDHAILAFLDIQPTTGYNLKKCFDQSVGHFWSATQSHIYKALDRLDKQGWTEVHLIPQVGKPNRKEIQITETGKYELHRWLTTPLPLEPVRAAWLIQIFFAYKLTNDEIAALFEARIEAIQARLQRYQHEAQAILDENANQVGSERVTRLWQLTLDYGIHYYQSELAWLEQNLAVVRELAPLNNPNLGLPHL